jgi:hypothetical protein
LLPSKTALLLKLKSACVSLLIRTPLVLFQGCETLPLWADGFAVPGIRSPTRLLGNGAVAVWNGVGGTGCGVISSDSSSCSTSLFDVKPCTSNIGVSSSSSLGSMPFDAKTAANIWASFSAIQAPIPIAITES